MTEQEISIARRAAEYNARIRAQREETKCRNIKDVSLSGKNGHFAGTTKAGLPVQFDRIEFGMTEQGLYGAGTLKAKYGDEWRTIFTKGYPSRALAWMAAN